MWHYRLVTISEKGEHSLWRAAHKPRIMLYEQGLPEASAWIFEGPGHTLLLHRVWISRCWQMHRW